MHHAVALMMAVATMTLVMQLLFWQDEGPGIRRAMGRIVCANRGSHRLMLAERHYLLPNPRTERRPFCTTCRALIGD